MGERPAQDDAERVARAWLNRCILIEDDFRDGEAYEPYAAKLTALVNDIASALRAVGPVTAPAAAPGGNA